MTSRPSVIITGAGIVGATLATGEIVAGNEAEGLAPCRLSRFG